MISAYSARRNVIRHRLWEMQITQKIQDLLCRIFADGKIQIQKINKRIASRGDAEDAEITYE